MNKLTKFLLFLLASGVTSLFLISCEDYEDKLTGSNPEGNAVDVSERITGFDSEISGAGASLTVQGNNLSDVKRVYVMNSGFADDVEASETAVSFTVPTNVPLGVQELVFVFAGNERATASIEMVPLPVIDYWDLQQGDPGDKIILYGTDLNIVEEASIGGVSASVSDVSSESLTITVPDGAETGPIGLMTPAGDVASSMDFVVCSNTPENPYCLTPLNGNGGFENGTVGVLGEGGDIGGGGFTAGSPGAQWEIINSPGGAAGLGDLSLSVTINELQNDGNDAWRIQYVNNGPPHPSGDLDGYEVPANSRFTILVKLWADQSGRIAAVNGGRRTPCCAGFDGGQEFTLSKGWNVYSFEVQHSAGDHDAGNDVHAAMEVNVNYPENLGGQIIIDDFRMVRIGDYQ